MIALLSPSKTQDYEDGLNCKTRTQPALKKDCLELVDVLSSFSKKKLQDTLGVSAKLAELNFGRYQNFSPSFKASNSRQALLAFRGDVYSGIEVESYKDKDFSFAQDHIRILSGLYGVLRPLDCIQPYRLEMKTKLQTSRGKNLYEFWDNKVSKELEKALQQVQSDTIVNLASNEYFKVLQQKKPDARIVTPVFKEKKGKTLKTIALFAKQARGEMANYIVKKRLTTPERLKEFSESKYSYDPKLSSDDEFVFIR